MCSTSMVFIYDSVVGKRTGSSGNTGAWARPQPPKSATNTVMLFSLSILYHAPYRHYECLEHPRHGTYWTTHGKRAGHKGVAIPWQRQGGEISEIWILK